ncbi:Acetyltransferase Pat [Defluviimonas aquaemixtae]|uniref:Acetyltransferase Pat n=1 Tax=Albidovulum aquaemixtae TaxID=1542388 RepID=A0A2R8BP43_9RHOB|nr:GNAT family N-acetyltransferase [Defluviimonas aquaemixtae]SPH25145.1 Acetyltransferase Pat [Defluviimonas aquaemixtae]
MVPFRSSERLTEAELDRFTAPSNRDRVAVGALTEDDLPPEPVAVARHIRLGHTRRAAEIAATTVDKHQGLGLGRLLLSVLAKLAGRNGISEFVAYVQRENAQMRALLDQFGSTQTRIGGGEIEFRVPRFDNPDRYPRTPVGDTFRRACALANAG